MVETIQFRKMQTHINVLTRHVTHGGDTSRTMIENLRGYFISQGHDAATATRQAYGAVWGMVQRQASMLSYNDTFFFLAIMFVVMLPLLFLLRKPKPGAGPAMAH